MLELNKEEIKLLSKLKSPQKIQDFLDTLAFNYEKKGETCMSPRRVIRERKANCIEGAFLAGVCLWMQGEKPLLLNLKVNHKDDYDHVVVLYKQNGYWGSISKTNHSVLRFRDPIYKTVRELAMSYFHEYFLTVNGQKTMSGYSSPINLKKFGEEWVTEEKDLWEIAESIYDSKHFDVVPKVNEKLIRKAHSVECAGANISEWDIKDKST